VIRMAGTVALMVKLHDEVTKIDIGDADSCKCDIYPSRGGSDATRAVLTRKAADSLLAQLTKLDQNSLSEEAKKSIRTILSRSGSNGLRRALTTGVALEQEIAGGVIVTEKMTAAKGWCGIVVEMDVAGNA
jgi:hypothetical protein